MTRMDIAKEKHDPERSQKALDRLADRDDKIGRLCRMMLDEDDCQPLDDTER